jgi:Protein of unknown function (DUF4232)
VGDIDDELRELFQRRADEVPHHTEVPPSLVRRGRRRFALNAMGVGLSVVLVAAGAFAGVRALSGLPAPLPAGSTNPPPTQPTPSPLHTTPAPSASPSGSGLACTAAQLRATVSPFSGAAGSRGGPIVVTNRSKETCKLEGTPAITLLDQNQAPITTGITFSSSQPAWVLNRSPKPAGWPVVTLKPGDAASVQIIWGNWCLAPVAVPIWRLGIPGGGTVDVTGFDASSVPPCNGPAQPSTIQEGPLEPHTGP